MNFLKYSKDLSYSYVFGTFGTIELLNHKAKYCLAVIVCPSFTNKETFLKIKELCKKNKIPLIIDLKLISKIRDKGNIYVVGVFQKYQSILTNNRHLLLNEINDIGLIGTVIRSMKGFDFENLVLINCQVDIYHYHLIRATMGAFFSTNIECFSSMDEYLNKYSMQKVYYINAKEGLALSKVGNDQKISLLFSNKEIDNGSFVKINFKENISLDNIINIVLFSIYQSLT